jgi:hypothetical protein
MLDLRKKASFFQGIGPNPLFAARDRLVSCKRPLSYVGSSISCKRPLSYVGSSISCNKALFLKNSDLSCTSLIFHATKLSFLKIATFHAFHLYLMAFYKQSLNSTISVTNSNFISCGSIPQWLPYLRKQIAWDPLGGSLEEDWFTPRVCIKTMTKALQGGV